MKAIVSADGLMAQAVNPYHKLLPARINVCDNSDVILNSQWDGFNKANPPRPLTTPQEPGATIEVKEVWQYQHRGSTEWLTCEKTDFKTFEEYSSYMFNSWDCGTRIALEPTHPLDGCNPDKDNCTPHEEYVDAVIANRNKIGLYEDDCVRLKNPPQCEWNLAIDEAVKVLDMEWNYENGFVLCDHTRLNTIQRIKYLLKKLKKN